MSEQNPTIAATIAGAADRLNKAGVAEPRREAASLLAFALDKEAVFLIAHPEYELTSDESARFKSAILRRERREPYHYITGTKEFYGLDFTIVPGVLIPRPETELIVEQAINLLADIPEPQFLEIGVGSGCISVAILHHVTHARAEAVDISNTALTIARANAVRHDVADRLKLRPGDVFGSTRGKFNLIVSNPPYIPDDDSASLQAEVGDYEPDSALFGGVDGLDIMRRIVTRSPEFLRSKGVLLIEIGFGQAANVKGLFDDPVWSRPTFILDLQGIERVVKARIRR